MNCTLSAETLWDNCNKFMSNNEKTKASGVCKYWREGYFKTKSVFTLPYIQSPTDERPKSTAIACIAKCGFFGSEANYGFCSSCAKNKKNNPSLQTLAQFKAWNEKMEEHEDKIKTLLTVVDKMKHLQSFHSCFNTFYESKVNESLPFDISYMGAICGTSLKCLCLPFVSLTDELIIQISSKFPNLLHLDLRQRYDEPEISIDSWKQLNKLKKLEHLNISFYSDDMDYEGEYPDIEIIQSLTSLENLKALSVIGLNVHESFSFLLNFPKLEILALPFVREYVHEESMLEPLTKLPLWYLDIRNMNISDQQLRTLSRIPNLEYLFLQDCRDITEEAVEKYLKPLKHLKVLRIDCIDAKFTCFNDGGVFFRQEQDSSDTDWSDKLSPCIHCREETDPRTGDFRHRYDLIK